MKPDRAAGAQDRSAPWSRKVVYGPLALAFVLSVVLVPFQHRTLVSTPEGGFAWNSERVIAPLWAQPTFPTGVAEYPFAWLLGLWGWLAATAFFVFVVNWMRSRRDAGR